jgi:hypothetical protein
MVNNKKLRRGVIAAIVVTAAILAPVMTASAQDNGVQQDGAGKYAQLTAQWWQWILEQPAAGNPNLDSTGAAAANGQPRQDVFFVAGTFGDTAAREFTVPANTSLFLPVLNSVGFGPLPAPQPKPDQNQVPQLRALFAAPFVDDATELHVTLDGVSLLASVTRVKSPVFHFTLPNVGNIFQFFGLDITGTFTAVSDGYWLFLPPLSPGTHVLKFGGTSEGATVDVTDTITVQ